jgi:hypothetical protein
VLTARPPLRAARIAPGEFVGATVTGSAQLGVWANISTRQPALCGPQGSTAVWVGEVNIPNPASPPNYPAIVQIGYYLGGTKAIDVPKPGWQVFDEKKSCGGRRFVCNPIFRFFGHPSGTNTYKVVYNSVKHRFNLWYNGQGDHTFWSPQTLWTHPWKAEFFGETHQCNQDVAGTRSNPVVFSNVQVRSKVGSWQASNILTLKNIDDCSGPERYQRWWNTRHHSFRIYTYPTLGS